MKFWINIFFFVARLCGGSVLSLETECCFSESWICFKKASCKISSSQSQEEKPLLWFSDAWHGSHGRDTQKIIKKRFSSNAPHSFSFYFEPIEPQFRSFRGINWQIGKVIRKFKVLFSVIFCFKIEFQVILGYLTFLKSYFLNLLNNFCSIDIWRFHFLKNWGEYFFSLKKNFNKCCIWGWIQYFVWVTFHWNKLTTSAKCRYCYAKVYGRYFVQDLLPLIRFQ